MKSLPAQLSASGPMINLFGTHDIRVEGRRRTSPHCDPFIMCIAKNAGGASHLFALILQCICLGAALPRRCYGPWDNIQGPERISSCQVVFTMGHGRGMRAQ